MSRSDCSFARLSNGLRLAYVEQGRRDGPAIIMLHGYTDSHRSFDLLRPHLPEGWRVIAMTSRGHGQSDKPDGDYAMTDLASDVPALLDALDIERAVVVGHSMGAAQALQVAADCPDRVSGLVLMGAFAGSKHNAAVAELAAEVARFENHVDPEFVLAFQESTFAEMIPQRFLDVVIAESLRCPAFVWRAALHGQVGAAIIDAALRSQAPALLIRGEKDALAPAEDQLTLRDLLASARIFTMRGVGHAAHWERPAETSVLIQAFVGELADSGIIQRREEWLRE
jgi:pimeloyl-ACP methyl ester carboxylesterase